MSCGVNVHQRTCVLCIYLHTQRIYLPGDNDVGGEMWDERTEFKVNRFNKHFRREELVNANFVDFFTVSIIVFTIYLSHIIRLYLIGVIFDSDFSFHKHISNICKSCFYHIRDLRRIRRHLPLSTAKTISNSLITSRLDYCNSLINNIAQQDLSKLQRV